MDIEQNGAKSETAQHALEHFVNHVRYASFFA